jgi:hypothetical protein
MKWACFRGSEIGKDVPPTRDSESATTVPHSYPKTLLTRGRVALVRVCTCIYIVIEESSLSDGYFESDTRTLHELHVSNNLLVTDNERGYDIT